MQVSKLPVPQRPRWPSDLAQKGEQAVASPSVRSGPIPTPLYVTQQGKGVMLKFKTQEEADAAWRMLSALAEAHADRTHKEQEDGNTDLSRLRLE